MVRNLNAYRLFKYFIKEILTDGMVIHHAPVNAVMPVANKTFLMGEILTDNIKFSSH